MEPATWLVTALVSVLFNFLGFGEGLDIKQVEMDLAGQWQFMKGDNMAWKDAEYRTETWGTIQVPAAWESQGNPGYDGYGWYRRTVLIPKEWQKVARGLILEVGQIDDEDVTFFNGEEAGSSNGWDVPRSYAIPLSRVKFGAENVIAVRVYDSGGGGGIHSGPIRIRTGTSSQFNVDRY